MRTRSRGAASVEFAILLPVFMAMLLGIVEYGWVFYQEFNVASAVREGVRAGVTVRQSASPDPVATAVARTTRAMQDLGVDITGATIAATYTGAAPTRSLNVRMTMPYVRLTGFVPTPANLAYQMTMLLEQQN
jgi:Flp pilus assembly protein TadG